MPELTTAGGRRARPAEEGPMTETTTIVDHPCNLDRTASLIQQRIDLKWVNREIYRVRGGYLVCVGLNLALRELAPSAAEAIAAQDAFFANQ